MKRIPLKERELPDYLKGEEMFNFISHIAGGGIGVIILVLSVVFSAIYNDVWAVVGSSVYGFSMVLLYTMSSIYHGLNNRTAKKVFQVLDHCTIYFLIAGTYTPILLSAIRPINRVLAFSLFGAVWIMCILGTVFTAIDLNSTKRFSMVCYIGMGWCIVVGLKDLICALTVNGFLWLLSGGIAYTLGAVFFLLGTKVRYMHSLFHLFVILGSLLQFIAIFFYVIL